MKWVMLLCLLTSLSCFHIPLSHRFRKEIGQKRIHVFCNTLFSASRSPTRPPTRPMFDFLKTSTAPTEEQQKIIEERHLNHSVTGIYAVESSLCKHGKPRAFIQYPVGGRISSGMIRLTCPHLVKAIDEWEADGAIDKFNKLLEKDTVLDTGKTLRENFNEINMIHQNLRQLATTCEERELMDNKLGKVGAENLMNSGIIGISQGKLDDVKCLHAHTADELLRGENEIGKLVLKGLQEERNIDPKGCDECQQQCDLQIDKNNSEWWYTPAKNKQRLRQKKERRKTFKTFLRNRERERQIN